MKELQPTDKDRFEILKKTVRDGLAICFVVGAALREIKERQFYLADGHKTFEDFCDTEWGWTKRYCNQLIVDANAINSLPPTLRKLITSHNAAMELSKIDPILRPVVVRQIAAGNKAVTGKSLKVAAPPPRKELKPKPAPPARSKSAPVTTDATKTEVPKECLALWNRGGEAGEILTYLSAIRGRIKKAQDLDDLLFVEVDFTDSLAKLNQVYVDMERAKPYAVCPTCQGKLLKGCLSCKGRGFVSEFYWKQCVPEEVRNLRK